jgi:aldose 1-epimerase
MRSGMITVLLLGGVLIGLTVAYRAHTQGNFHKLKLKANIDTERLDAPVPEPGGQEPIELLRSRIAGERDPEFLSATLLPGRGMNVLQITAFIPGRGEVNLLASPSIDTAAKTMTGTGEDAGGRLSLAMGGAIEAPWAGGLGPSAAANGVMDWHGQPIPLIATKAGGAAGNPEGGLLLADACEAADSEALPDGETVRCVFHGGDFGGRWTSRTDVTVNALLSSHAIELTMVATNVGNVAEPVGIGWQPRFAINGQDRNQMRLHLPAESRIEVRDREKGQPTGKLLPVAGTAYNFTAEGGAGLRGRDLDDYFVELQQKLLDNGPSAELINPAGGYGLRLTALSPTIRTIRVIAPADGNFISIDEQYNFPDPFGKEWGDETNTGMIMLQPGQSTEWKVRLELFAVDPNNR